MACVVGVFAFGFFRVWLCFPSLVLLVFGQFVLVDCVDLWPLLFGQVVVCLCWSLDPSPSMTAFPKLAHTM